ncbi:MAG: ankyrin repeat domain-containing protein [Vulcanimicrobiota bacterium]
MVRLLIKASLAGFTGATLGGLMAGLISIARSSGLGYATQVGLASLLVMVLMIGLVNTVSGLVTRSSKSATLAGLVVGGFALMLWYPSQGAELASLGLGAVGGAALINLLVFLRMPKGSQTGRAKLVRMTLAAAREIASKGTASDAALAYTEAFKLAEATLGAGHPDTLEAVLGLAEARLRAGAHDQVLTLLTEVRQPVEEMFGPESAELARVLEGLALAGGVDGDALERAVAIRRQLDPPLGLAETLTSLGKWRVQAGQSEAGLEALDEACQLEEAPALCWLEYGRALASSGRREQAVEALGQVHRAPQRSDRLRASAYLALAEVETEKATGHYLKALKLLQFGDAEFEAAFFGHATVAKGDALGRFLQAAASGQALVEAIEACPEGPAYQGPEGWSALHWAAARGDLEQVELLLEHGAVPRDGRASPLHLACASGHREVAARLLEAGAELDTRDSYHLRSPLFFATMGGDVELIRLLAEQGAEVDTEDGFGQRPLHYASFSGNTEVVRALAELGADLDAADRETGQTALHVAVARNRVGCVKALLELGADPSRRERLAGWTARDLALQTGKSALAGLFPE